MKIGAIGICQMRGFGLAMAHLCPDAEVKVYDLDSVRRHGKAAQTTEYLTSCDFIFTHWIGNDGSEIATEQLKSVHSNVIIVPLVAFRGWHPDMTYLILKDEQYMSPIGPYHSSLVAAAYAKGLDEWETHALFNRIVFQKLGFFDEFDASWALMKRTFSDHDGYDEFMSWDNFERGPFMHTLNHPKIDALCEVARAGAVRTGLALQTAQAPKGLHDALSHFPQWPIYPEISQSLGCEGSYLFKPTSDDHPDGMRPVIGLQEMIARSFQMYRSYPEELFLTQELAPVRAKLSTL